MFSHVSDHEIEIGGAALCPWRNAHAVNGSRSLPWFFAMSDYARRPAPYELSQFDAMAAPGDPAPDAVHYETRWRPSGGLGITWQPIARLLFGTRAILNHDQEVRTDDAGTSEALARS